MKKIDGDVCHEKLVSGTESKLAFASGLDYFNWRNNVRDKFKELFGLNRISENICPRQHIQAPTKNA